MVLKGVAYNLSLAYVCSGWVYKLFGTTLSVVRVDFPDNYFDELISDRPITQNARCCVSPTIDLLTDLESGLCVLESMADSFKKTG